VIRSSSSCKTLLFSVLIGMFVVACAGFPDENVDPAKNNKANYNKDLKECREDYPEQGSGVHYRQWIGCMKLKGWK